MAISTTTVCGNFCGDMRMHSTALILLPSLSPEMDLVTLISCIRYKHFHLSELIFKMGVKFRACR